MTAQRILIVDDEPQIQRFLRPSLAAAGYEVVAVANGRDALKAAAPDSPMLSCSISGFRTWTAKT